MAAAHVAQRPYSYDAPDQQRAARSSINVVSTSYVVEIGEFRKVFVWCGVVGDAQGSGKLYHGILKFATK
jgi:hypothetical protein